ncbi:MAG: methenyltetrahydromethanopterin cyclohydrolase [Gammaproteobacteria bacterium]|jgi:methenyltetrahydromethanopterin cyclohydrolase|nr:methenyltetrahydromethanopterin cyclohydrolase [Gammaproteobacteria bacterium]
MNTKNLSAVPSLNQLTAPLVQSMIENAEGLRLSVSTLENQTTVIDAGIETTGGIEAGRQIAEICMGGLGIVKLRASTNFERWSWHVDVHSSNPVLACLASQYAGWSLSHGKGKEAFNALGSGPARAIGSKDPLFDELAYRDKNDKAYMVIEVDKLPPAELADEIALRCNVTGDNLTLILTPTSSLAGAVQIVSRVLETALHKAHALGFELENIIDGTGSAPVCPPSPDFLKAMSRTNDAILFAGQVQLFVDSDSSDAEQLANSLPSSASSDYGRPFGEIFKAVEYDFYKIDPMLFSPARVTVSSLKTGESFHSGRVDLDLLNQSFS